MSKPAKKKAPAKPESDAESVEAPKAPPMDAAISRVISERRRRSAKTAGKKRP
jgi:hypothetical protein